MIASTFGDGQVAYSILWFFLFFIEVWLAVSIFIDIFRSHDLPGWAKAAHIPPLVPGRSGPIQRNQGYYAGKIHTLLYASYLIYIGIMANRASRLVWPAIVSIN